MGRIRNVQCPARRSSTRPYQRPSDREQTMSTGGLSKAWLARLHVVIAGYVERGEVPGVVSLVSRRGEVHVDAIGMKDTGFSVPATKLDGLATCYKVNPETGLLHWLSSTPS